MKVILNICLLFLLAGSLFQISCKKEKPSSTVINPPPPPPPSPPFNSSPVARAGTDQVITLPANTVNLDGSGSTDPDHNIISFAWTKISGPLSFNILNVNGVQTQVTNLVLGNYQFELKVTDTDSLFSKDTIQITVNAEAQPPPTTCDPGVRPLINSQLVPFGNLSEARNNITIGMVGNKILFAGGIKGYGPIASSRVDIYDTNLNTWSTAELSQARFAMASGTLGNKIYFAGGSLDGGHSTSRIDIYDATSNAWSTAELSESREYPVAGVVGNKIFFAGGGSYFTWPTNRVDIYDNLTDTWSIAALSVARVGIRATTAGNKIYFAGGDWDPNDFAPTPFIDIYDGTTSSWSTANLSESKVGHAAIAVNDKIYWAGGSTNYPSGNSNPGISNLVEIRDINAQTSTFACLFQPNGVCDAVLKNNKIVFIGTGGIGNNKFDIYDVTNNIWSIGVLNRNIEPAAIISVNNIIYVAGEHINGGFSNQVWKLEF